MSAFYDGKFDVLLSTAIVESGLDIPTANTLVDGLPVAGILSPYTKRYAKGFSGEFLDAFVFANFDAGDIPVSVKAGQHTVYWGDSLLLGGAIHGVSYGQNPIDVWKGFATPGSEAKELFRPRGGLTLRLPRRRARRQTPAWDDTSDRTAGDDWCVCRARC